MRREGHWELKESMHSETYHRFHFGAKSCRLMKNKVKVCNHIDIDNVTLCVTV